MKRIICGCSLYIWVFFIFNMVNFANAQVNLKATLETKNLYQSLHSIYKESCIFGQQDALAYGLTKDKARWIAQDASQSDIKTISGQHPGVIGWDLGRLELNGDDNLDGVPFDFMKKSIVEIYKNGGINTLSWHPNNPLDFSKTTWDKVDKTIPRILNNKKNLRNYKKTLDKLADFILDLKSDNGELVPVIFRPYHEHTGSWFWWGADHCSPQEYKDFWKMTYEHLTKKRKVNNLIWAYSTDNFRDEAHYLARYPGDEFVDILGFDTYHRNAPSSNQSFIDNTKMMLGVVSKLAIEKDKLTAITETGLEKVTETNWWTSILLPILKESNPSYVLVWRNGRPDHFYAPFEGHESATDFLELLKSNKILLQTDIQKRNIYQKH
jgi:mannan endo-1,4-beta-mannosidase